MRVVLADVAEAAVAEGLAVAVDVCCVRCVVLCAVVIAAAATAAAVVVADVVICWCCFNALLCVYV